MARPEIVPAPEGIQPQEDAVRVSVVVTVYNERASLAELHRRTLAALEAGGSAFELLYVDDGSADGSFEELVRLRDGDERVRIVKLKRNAGQHPAMHAGL